jgi:hypothetical protein
MLNSLPMGEKKEAVNQTEQPQQGKREVVQEKTVKVEPRLDEIFYRERDQLEHELGEHKNRIKKLEQDIMAAMKLFEESEEKSEMNKSKLL